MPRLPRALDLLDNISAGHLTHPSPSPSPERAPAPGPGINNDNLDGPGGSRLEGTALPIVNIAHAYADQQDVPQPPPPPPTYPSAHPAPPAYRRTPPPRSTSLHGRAGTFFLHWLRLVYLDGLFMVLVCLLTGTIMLFSHVVFRWNERHFPMTWDPVSAKWYGPAELSHPHSEFVLGILFTALVIPAVGVAVLVGMQVWVRSFWDANAALFGLFKGFVMITFIHIFLKQWIGEFRPFFITVCNPVLPPPNMTDPFPFRRFVTPDSCRPLSGSNEHPQVFAMQSFPSGHTSEAFFVGTFLALYLNAKLKAFSDYHTSFWKWLAVMLPLFGSCLIAGTLVVDRNHHVHDILLSIPGGVLIAMLAYRSHYASLFNYRTNHLPLPWSGTHRSLTATVPESETEHGDNLAAVRWPRRPIEHSFDGAREQADGLGLDGATGRLRGPVNITRGRLRQNMFPQPTGLMQGFMRNRTGAFLPNDQGDFDLRDAADLDAVREGSSVRAAEGPSTARATGHQMDLEGQRQRRRTAESGDGMG